jgi:hypothetical protein
LRELGVSGGLFDEEPEGDATLSANFRARAASSVNAELELASTANAQANEGYALDGVTRFLRPTLTSPSCSPVGLVPYFGTSVQYWGVAVVSPAFRSRLLRFERIVRDVALATYGRAPLRIRHRGAYACRSRRNQPRWLSEHALGNAIDVSGFDFGPPGPSDPRIAPDVPTTAFRVSVARDWQNESDPISARHALFLRSLLARLLARNDVFRGVIGPEHEGHFDHFHFDMAPHRYLSL